MSLTKDQITSVKRRGFLLNRGTECFSGRIVTVAGLFTPDELRAVASAPKIRQRQVDFHRPSGS